MNLTLDQIDEQQKDRDKKRAEFVRKNTPAWRVTGSEHKALRETWRLTLREMSRLTGFSSTKLSGFEHGNPIMNRRVVEQSYALVFTVTALKMEALINRMRVIAAEYEKVAA